MGRKPRVFVEGGVYHVYCRTAHGVRAFEDEGEAVAFVDVLRQIKERDGLVLYAWCLMANHYHLALRTTRVPLWRSMASLNVRVTKGYNRRSTLLGPLWQTRYRAKFVLDQRYLEQLILYVHLNPVVAGVVAEPGEYRWSGHHELMGRREPPLVDVDECLFVFGNRRGAARRSYSKRLAAIRDEVWPGEEPGRLPWWGRSKQGDEEIETRKDVPYVDYLGRTTAPERPSLSAAEYISRVCEALDVGLEEISGRGRTTRLRESRELLAVVGVESYCQRVAELAEILRKNPGSVSRWVTCGAERLREDQRFREQAGALDAAVSRGNGGG